MDNKLLIERQRIHNAVFRMLGVMVVWGCLVLVVLTTLYLVRHL